MRRFLSLGLRPTQSVHTRVGWRQTAAIMIERTAVGIVMESSGGVRRSNEHRLGQFTSQIVMPHAQLERRQSIVANQAMRHIWTEMVTA